MRYQYYFHAQKREKIAMQYYKELTGDKPDLCANCEGFCEQACPYDVNTRGLMALAYQNLGFKTSRKKLNA